MDLFAGCGGLSLGLENAGFTPLIVNELADEARATYLENRAEFKHLDGSLVDDPNHPWVWKDVKQLRKYISEDSDGFCSKVEDTFGINISKGELDLLVGGPPCQGFSGIGHRRSYSVDKKNIRSNHLYEDMMYLIDKLRPKMFLFENVRGLLSARWDGGGGKGEIWRDIRQAYKKHLGENYQMGWHLVRAKDYGVPQNRPRVLLVGVRNDLNWKPLVNGLDEDGILLHDSVHRAGGLLPSPTLRPPTIDDLLSDLVDPDYEPGQTSTNVYPSPVSKNKNSVQRLLRTDKSGQNIFPKGHILTEHDYSRHKDHVVEKFKYMLENEGKIHAKHKTKKFAQRVLPREWKNGEPSITATSLPDDYVHFSQPRVPSVREWARLQFFPDWYQFKGKRTTGGIRRAGNPRENNFDREVPKYTQIGNAVPVRMAEEVGKHFLDLIIATER